MTGEIDSQAVQNILDRLDAMGDQLRERSIDISRLGLDGDFVEMRSNLFSLSQSMRRDIAMVHDVMDHMKVVYVEQISALLFRVNRLEQGAQA
jgi:hypothetical protein